MRTPARPGKDQRALGLVGAALSVAAGAVLFSPFGINGALSRDEAVVTYGAQQLAKGVPPYVSIFDVKSPGATFVAGAAVEVADVLGRSDLYLVRALFFVCACLAVLAVYLLASSLFGWWLSGLVAAVVFACFRGFAMDALSGPDAKTPGVLLFVSSMWLLTRRSWFWGAFLGSLAFVVWQPLAIYPAVACLAAVVCNPRGRRAAALGRALAGAALPVVAVLGYFTLAGALGKLIEAPFVFPLVGIRRDPETHLQRLRVIAGIVTTDYRFSGVLLWVGLVLLVVVTVASVIGGRDRLGSVLTGPLVLVVFLTFLVQVAFAASDFQSYPDLYPLLPYAALGFGGAVAGVLATTTAPALRRAMTAVTLAVLVGVTAYSWVLFRGDDTAVRALTLQRADGCALERMAGGGTIDALGDPAPLVLLHRTNPDRYIYLGSGASAWKIRHTPGGFGGWTDQIRAADPPVVVVHGWSDPAAKARMATWLRGDGYRSSYVGPWHVFLTPAARHRAHRHGVALAPGPTAVVLGPHGHPVRSYRCVTGAP